METKVPYDYIQSLLDSLTFRYQRVDETTVTGCWAFLPNGFQVGYGQSACVDINVFDEDLGKQYARSEALRDAENTLWKLEGYLLKTTGYLSRDFDAPNSPWSQEPGSFKSRRTTSDPLFT